MTIKVYQYESDDLTEVTQEWCVNAQRNLNALWAQREIIRIVAGLHAANNADKIVLLYSQVKEFIKERGDA